MTDPIREHTEVSITRLLRPWLNQESNCVPFEETAQLLAGTIEVTSAVLGCGSCRRSRHPPRT
ncbi:hypothetical protein [Kitasatospora sp. NPDC088548]|uniref:hypothetical protein n=1 Tax=Kitasatospora sp. NPDC088548 TaxID=3364075 RepID=UPI00380D634F